MSSDEPDGDNATDAAHSGGRKVVGARFSPFDPIWAIQKSAGDSSWHPQYVTDQVDVADETEPQITDVSSDGAIPETGPDRTSRRRQGETRARTRQQTSPSTQDYYQRQVEGLMRRYRDQRGIPDDIEISPPTFANWVLGLLPLYERSAWRAYCNAAVDYLDATDQPEASAWLAAENGHGARSGGIAALSRNTVTGKKTSRAQKQAHQISYRSYECLIDALRVGGESREWREVVHDFVDATLATGLLPLEWRAADVVREAGGGDTADRVYLRVLLPAAIKNFAAQPVLRTLEVTTLDAERFARVARMTETGAAWESRNEFAKRMKYVNQILRKICASLRLHGSQYRITAQTFHHQFIANAKPSFSCAELAAMVGQNDVEKAADEYRRRADTWPPDVRPSLPAPLPYEVSLVEERVQAYCDECRRIRMSTGKIRGPSKFVLTAFRTT